ncbi:MAG TPA: septum formation initiator family protein [Treponema sp.]|nr:septum formation initiator family protein [Treponema sp.]
MKYLRIVLPLFLGTLIYSLLSFSAGPKGFWPFSQLEVEYTRINQNLETLQNINGSLEARLANLTSDSDTISVYAHELGYIHEGEKLIKLAGFTGGIDRTLYSGSALESRIPQYVPEWICKITGILFGLLSFFVMDLFKRKYTHDNKKRRC